MNGPIRMVLVNIISSVILLMGVVIFKKKYPHKKINLLSLLILVTLLPIINIFRPGDYQSGDFNTHIYRAIDFYTSLIQGQLLPSWAGNLNNTYGYPLFIFLEPLPYYLISGIHVIGFSFIFSLKLLLAGSFILSGIFFYLWAKEETGDSLASFSGAVIYLFTPYHLIDLNFRADIGEVLAFTMLPLFFYTLRRYIKNSSFTYLLISALAFCLMTLAHQAISAFSLLIIFPFILYNAYQSKKFIYRTITYSFPIITGLIFSCYAWLPHLLFTKYTYADALANQGITYISLSNLLYSPWRFGLLFQGPQGQLAFIIGYTQVGIIFACIYFLLVKKVKGQLILWTVMSLFVVFLMVPYSKSLWQLIPFLQVVQYSYRLLLISTFTISASMVFLAIALRKKKRFIVVLLLVSIGYTILNWGQRTVLPQISDSTLIAGQPGSTNTGEGEAYIASPKWINIKSPWMQYIPKEHLQFIQGSGTIVTIKRISTEHDYLIYTPVTSVLQENTYYFPDWQVKIDGKPSALQISTHKNPGLILFKIAPGLHMVSILYQDIAELFIIKILSVTTITLSMLFLLWSFLRKKVANSFADKNKLISPHTSKKRKR